jgi:hypothetical protein
MPFMEEYSVDDNFGTFFQRKNILGMIAISSLVSPLHGAVQKIYENYTIRDKILEELQ